MAVSVNICGLIRSASACGFEFRRYARAHKRPHFAKHVSEEASLFNIVCAYRFYANSDTQKNVHTHSLKTRRHIWPGFGLNARSMDATLLFSQPHATRDVCKESRTHHATLSADSDSPHTHTRGGFIDPNPSRLSACCSRIAKTCVLFAFVRSERAVCELFYFAVACLAYGVNVGTSGYVFFELEVGLSYLCVCV